MRDDYLHTAIGALHGFEGITTTTARIAVMLVMAWLAFVSAQSGMRWFRVRMTTRFDNQEMVKHTATLCRVIRYVAAVVISAFAGSLVLAEMGIPHTPILGAAGVVGLAVGLAARSLGKDYFNGLVLLFESQIRQGDVVGDVPETVEQMS